MTIAHPPLRRSRHDLFSVSYTDYRHLPEGSRYDTTRSRPRNAAQLSRSAPLDDVQLWFTRSGEGLVCAPDSRIPRRPGRWSPSSSIGSPIP
ncbi:hypothetical protein ACFQZZ_16780 [Nocardia sp. GCM10030253]|uniref:hypothetical protein n=1 Tax=Nocardia sp. GCM10030253 TaxID=3273404 RepID=UPI00363EF78B